MGNVRMSTNGIFFNKNDHNVPPRPPPQNIHQWSEWPFMGITCSEGRVLPFTCGSSLDHHLLHPYHRHIWILGYISMKNVQEYSV